jgi:hypothetical protein
LEVLVASFTFSEIDQLLAGLSLLPTLEELIVQAISSVDWPVTFGFLPSRLRILQVLAQGEDTPSETTFVPLIESGRLSELRRLSLDIDGRDEDLEKACLKRGVELRRLN